MWPRSDFLSIIQSFMQSFIHLLPFFNGNFGLTEKYPDCIGPMGWVCKMHQGLPNDVRPSTRCSLAALRCGYHMRSVRCNSVVHMPVQWFAENSLTKTNWHTRWSFFWCTYERMVIHGPNIPICLSGGDTWLSRIRSVVSVFCFHIPFLQAIYGRSVCMDLCCHAALRQCR